MHTGTIEKASLRTEKVSNHRLPSIQVLRGIAASMVVFHHWALVMMDSKSSSWIIQSGLGHLGSAGVDLFFDISGFIMVYTSRRKSGFKDAIFFLKRRIRRIYPLYWLWTTVLFALWVSHLALRTHRFSYSFLIGSYLLLPVYDDSHWHPLVVQGWTLTFEVFFYLLFACTLMLGLKRSRLATLVGAFAALFLVGSQFETNSAARYLLSNTITWEFLFGVLAAEIVLSWPETAFSKLWSKLGPVALVCVGSILLLVNTTIPYEESQRWLTYGIPSFLIVLGAAQWENAPAPKSLLFIGDASYSIYLSHGFITLAYTAALKHGPALMAIQPDPTILVGTVLTILLTALTYPTIERALAERILWTS